MASARTNLVGSWILTAIAAGLALFWSLPAAADAAANYKAKCTACHGADGKADTLVGKKTGTHDFASPDVKKMSDDELTAVIADGKEKMPSYRKSLTPSQIKELVGYIRSLAK